MFFYLRYFPFFREQTSLKNTDSEVFIIHLDEGELNPRIPLKPIIEYRHVQEFTYLQLVTFTANTALHVVFHSQQSFRS